MSRGPRVVLPGKGPNVVDRVVGFFSPTAGLRRAHARASLAVASSAIKYDGARRDRAATKNWTPESGSPDADTLPGIGTLRGRHRDLTRNTPLAVAAMNAAMTETIGPGFMVKSVIDHDVVGLSEDEAQEWEARAERLFRLAARNRQLDYARRKTFAAMQYTALWSALDAGDVLVVRRHLKRPGDLVSTKFDLIEADRVSNPGYMPDTPRRVAGVDIGLDGSHEAFHVATQHPGDDWTLHAEPSRWARVQAWGPESGERFAWLLYREIRPGQTRGVPFLAPVVEALKQVSDYGTSELHAAVVNSLFTVIVKSGIPGEEAELTLPGMEDVDDTPPADYRLGSGLVVQGGLGDEFEFVDPKRPNTAFDSFMTAWTRQIGAALGIPFEVLLKHFNSSFSASQAAMLEAWRFFQVWQQWMIDEFCQPIYELFIAEAVATGLLDAPGFFEDPLVRMAWCGTKWIGPRRGVVRPDVEMRAATMAVNAWLSTSEDEGARIFGSDWEHVYEQRAREIRRRRSAEVGDAPSDDMAGEPGASAEAGGQAEGAGEGDDATALNYLVEVE